MTEEQVLTLLFKEQFLEVKALYESGKIDSKKFIELIEDLESKLPAGVLEELKTVNDLN